MPLKSGSSHEVVSANIKELMATGHKQSQAVVIALKEAGLSNQDCGITDETSLEEMTNKIRSMLDPASKRKTCDFQGYYAPEKIGKTRRITPEGFLVLEGTPIARTGEQLYAAHELEGIEPNGSGYIVVSRPPEEVFRPETMQSFEGKDYVINHPPDGVDVENWKNHTVGHCQNVRRGSGIEDDLLLADIIVKDPMAIAHINKHLPENSAGYGADYIQTEPGKATQRNIIGNHVAAVRAGRAGARIAVRDHEVPPPEEVLEMTVKTTPKWSVMRAVMTAMGIKTEDVAKVETAVSALQTTDEGAGSGTGGESEYNTLANDMKAIKDWMKARDNEREEEVKKKKEKETADAEEAARKKKEEEGMEEEKTGDTILEAESPGHVINLGKTWKGGVTGDSAAPEPILAAVVARAEILAPGIAKPTADSIKGNKGVVLGAFMRQALKIHASTTDGAANLEPFLLGCTVDGLRGHQLVGAFNGTAQLVRMRNNTTTSLMTRRMTTGDGRAKAPSNAELNEQNRKFWADRARK